jgi:two-component system response regulator ChvI
VRLLLVDDDRSLVDVLAMALEDAGFEIDKAYDGKAGWERFAARPPDLAVLDLLMPEIDGLELCRRIRAAHRTPIILLTSRDQEMDKVLGLEMGADDYVTKPFSTRELIARIRAALRRAAPVVDTPAAVATHGRLRMDRSRRLVELAGHAIEMTATEFDLLWALLEQAGHVLDRGEIVRRLYGDVEVSDRTIDTFVKRLRRKLREADPQWDEIETVRAIGYRYKE